MTLKLDNRINVVYGHFGSGKTEFSINYALYLKRFFPKVALVDLDIINVYFRIREKRKFLEERGIEVIASSLKQSDTLDLPALDASILKPLENEEYVVVIDAGGDPKGSLVLRRFTKYLKNSSNHFVVNANRSETDDVQKVISYIGQIESFSGLRVNKLLNTTHMLKHTSKDDIIKGYNLCKKVSKETGIELKYNVCMKSLVESLKQDPLVDRKLTDKLFEIDLIFRDEWML